MIIIILIINIIIAILVFPTSVLPSLLLHLLLFGTIDFPPNYSFLVSSSPTIVIVIIISIITTPRPCTSMIQSDLFIHHIIIIGLVSSYCSASIVERLSRHTQHMTVT